ncbi:MAG: ABC transporter permease [Phycisphaerales bacterium]|nr:ABC transporter permease [Phycisphaerales bacterium]MCI0677090.1 ABC transporter permease [Phycisphaerales bacterium]
MLNPFFYVQAILLALSQIWVNKTRSFLTALGIIIGVASVTSVIAALSGLKTKVLTEFEKFGANKMLIFPNRPDGAPRNKYPWELVRLKPHELLAIRDNCPSIVDLTPQTSFGATIQHDAEVREGVNVTGIWPGWPQIENRDVLIGRPFTQLDEDTARQVCLVNDKAIDELKLDTDPTGQPLMINGRRFMIVGVVETIEANIFGHGTVSSEVYIPFSTAVKYQDEDFFFMIICRLKSPDVAEEAKAEATFVLRHSRKIQPNEPDTFEIAPIDQFIAAFKAMAAGITGVAGGIVGISLLVGGIGIMNIMLVSVSERTREIGLRKAVGATPAAILMQFLLEAVTLCFVGGAIGVLGGEMFALAVSNIPGVELKTTVPWWAVIMSFGFSAFVGVVFGMFPAIKAARLDPIDALRHE